jgi:hypothetical protein
MTKWSEATKQAARELRRKNMGIRPDRAQHMAELYKAGQTLQQIGDLYDMTRERVRQILREETDVPPEAGGIREQGRQTRQRREKAFEARKGMSRAQWKEFVAMGRAIIASGGHMERTPLGAFRRQKANAATRGISWRLTFLQWWDIWQRSGHWDDRGRGHAYAMCRYGDKGPYAVNNVYIATNAQNIKHYYARKLAEAA